VCLGVTGHIPLFLLPVAILIAPLVGAVAGVAYARLLRVGAPRSDYNRRLDQDGAIGGALGATAGAVYLAVTGHIPLYLLPVAIPIAPLVGVIVGMAGARVGRRLEE
jgi:CDP-diglyceride synthetase